MHFDLVQANSWIKYCVSLRLLSKAHEHVTLWSSILKFFLWKILDWKLWYCAEKCFQKILNLMMLRRWFFECVNSVFGNLWKFHQKGWKLYSVIGIVFVSQRFSTNMYYHLCYLRYTMVLFFFVLGNKKFLFKDVICSIQNNSTGRYWLKLENTEYWLLVRIISCLAREKTGFESNSFRTTLSFRNSV